MIVKSCHWQWLVLLLFTAELAFGKSTWASSVYEGLSPGLAVDGVR